MGYKDFPHVQMAITDLDREVVCELYDSYLDSMGSPQDIKWTQEISGWQTLEFNLPYVEDPNLSNHRWEF
jgi:hypothetical protein